ncbi:type I restriction enzyme, S subunit [Methylobacterium sp. UNC378MF]|uniref:restriction endonuclease subunit S n=1 Tax=Methylobacterium sp. UNC378MF TaxID=1502748 RepID=UPI00088BC973|nr:restriction endonuclease subunit S [Methylobacterium sp. UNC378MF]SDA15672.1 type I restriction enzyme, S subunit [Methylobacterium sp. UNC378MF]
MITVALGDVVTIKGGGTPSKAKPEFWGGDIPWVSPKDMKRWEIYSAEDNITGAAIRESSTNLIPVNSILVVNRSGILKHTLPVGLTRRPVAINQDIKALICSPESHPDYIAHILKAAEPIVLKWARATTVDNFSVDNLRELRIPLPPLNEQRRIAALLDKADALHRKRKRIIELVRSIPQSLFLEMFGDPQANPGRWNRTSPLSDVAEIGSGITKGRKEPSTALRTVPYLAVANVQDRALDLTNVKTIDASEEEIDRFRLKSGDLVLTEGGDPDKLGRGTVWRDELPEVIHQNHIFRVRVNANEIDPLYLNFLVGSEYGKKYFLRSAKQTTGIASINKAQLSRFPVLLPPLALQRKFSFEVERLAISQRQAGRADEAMLELFTSLRHRAFSGQL